MPTPADVPARLPAPTKAPRRRRRNCSHPDCHVRINMPRYACATHWKQLPAELQQRLKDTNPGRAVQPLERDHPFRIAAREAKAVWGVL